MLDRFTAAAYKPPAHPSRLHELELEHQIELDGIVQRNQPPVVQIRRRIFDPTQCERLDRAVRAVKLTVDQ